jgi:hypothetical protein
MPDLPTANPNLEATKLSPPKLVRPPALSVAQPIRAPGSKRMPRPSRNADR